MRGGIYGESTAILGRSGWEGPFKKDFSDSILVTRTKLEFDEMDKK